MADILTQEEIDALLESITEPCDHDGEIIKAFKSNYERLASQEPSGWK